MIEYTHTIEDQEEVANWL